MSMVAPKVARGMPGWISGLAAQWGQVGWTVRLALLLLVLFVLVALFGPYLVAHDPLAGSLRARLDPPVWQEGGSWAHVFGTDRLGRDILARLVAGAARLSSPSVVRSARRWVRWPAISAAGRTAS